MKMNNTTPRQGDHDTPCPKTGPRVRDRQLLRGRHIDLHLDEMALTPQLTRRGRVFISPVKATWSSMSVPASARKYSPTYSARRNDSDLLGTSGFYLRHIGSASFNEDPGFMVGELYALCTLVIYGSCL